MENETHTFGGLPLSPLQTIALASLVIATLMLAVAFALLLLISPLSASGVEASKATEWLIDLPPWRERRLQAEKHSAWRRSDYETAIKCLLELYALNPQTTAVLAELGTARFLYGQQLAQADQLEAALTQFEAAAAILPEQPAVKRAYQVTREYLAGRECYGRGDWTAASQHLQLVYTLDSQFKDVTRLLHGAHYQLGLRLQALGQPVQTRTEYEAALHVWGEGPEARARLAEVLASLATPTPTPTPLPPQKRIVVSISQQRMVLYEGGKTIHTWVCSTGEPGRDTKTGHFKVQTKLLSAYASVWDLDMPYWLGIYNAGPSENGIHGPPIQRATGQKMWEGLLGSRVSYGCVILNEAHVKALWEWAPLGTPVDIEP